MKNLTMLGRDFVQITQLGLSRVLPIVLSVWFARFLEKKFMLGSWVTILAIILGLGGAISNSIRFYKYVMKK